MLTGNIPLEVLQTCVCLKRQFILYETFEYVFECALHSVAAANMLNKRQTIIQRGLMMINDVIRNFAHLHHRNMLTIFRDLKTSSYWGQLVSQ